MRPYFVLPVLTLATACGQLSEVGKAPSFTPIQDGLEHQAMSTPYEPTHVPKLPYGEASLWTAGQQSLLGDRRAERRGDILTVVIQIDDSAKINNTTSRSRTGSESFGVPNMLGIPGAIEKHLPEGADFDTALEAESKSKSSGNGSVSRNEKLTLRIAATVLEVLPNGVLRIRGSQEVRVNYELRELQVDGYVRPDDITRRNEITYDKIASARISYGGRGQITQVQQPRIGQQVADILLPF